MHRRDNLAHFILAGVVVLGLTPLMVCVDAQAQGRIAFMSDRDWNWDIYVMDADGGNQRNLTNNPGEDKNPSWSPDGKRIAFVGNFDIYVMDADGGNPKNLTNSRQNDFSPSWSPDSKRIIFVSLRGVNSEIYVMDADGDNQRNLTNNPGDDKDPSWSPNGKRIAFSSARNGELHDIYVMDPDGGNPRNLTNHPEDEGAPAWYNSVLSVTPAGKTLTMWARLKQIDR